MGFREKLYNVPTNSDWSWANKFHSLASGLYLLHENDDGDTEGNLPLWEVADIKYEVSHNKNDRKMVMAAN